MSYEDAAAYSWLDETVADQSQDQNQDPHDENGSSFGEADFDPTRYQQQNVPYGYGGTNWTGDFEQQSLHYNLNIHPQTELYSQQPRNADASSSAMLGNNSQQIAHLSSRLFPALHPTQPPSIPNPNRDNIRQVKIPFNDIYRPSYISKEGSEREGYCRYCPTWANLKHSNYAYHMLKRHGVCKAYSQQFEPPQAMQIIEGGASGGTGGGGGGNVEGREGQRILVAWCGSCQGKVPLAGNPDLEGDYPRLTASWYSHAKECLSFAASSE